MRICSCGGHLRSVVFRVCSLNHTVFHVYQRRKGTGEDANKRDERLLNRLVRVKRGEMASQICLHHRTVAGDELAPAGVLGVAREVAKERRGRCRASVRPVFASFDDLRSCMGGM